MKRRDLLLFTATALIMLPATRGTVQADETVESVVKVNRNLYKKDNQKMYSFGHSRNNAGCGVAEGLQR